MTNPDTQNVKAVDGQRFLAFSLGQEDFALPLLQVKEVIAMPDVTSIPYSASHFLGIMNLRGQVISVVDLRMKFNIKPTQGLEPAVIICDLGNVCIGIVVDSVNAVLNLGEKDVQPRPDVDSKQKADYILGVTRKDKKLVLLVDIGKVLNVEDYSAAKQASAQ